MPGYDSDRFVDLSQNDKAELTCSICQAILYSPLFAQCCQQSFCRDCINDWLKNNKTCPYDRKPMTSSLLSRPPRVMLYMLGKLKINCDYKVNGCTEVILLENLCQHIINCRYNVVKCEKCLCEMQVNSSHDCIKALLELNQKANEKIGILEGDVSGKWLIEQFRSNHLTPEVISVDMNEDLKDRVLSIVKKEIVKEYITVLDFCNIKVNLDSEFGSNWHCIFSHQQNINTAGNHQEGYFLIIKFGEVYWKIYKTQYFCVPEFVERVKNGKIKPEIKIMETDMNESMRSGVKEITFAAIEKSHSMTEIAELIRAQISKKYPGNWQIFLWAHLGAFSLKKTKRLKSDTYICFIVDDLRLSLIRGSF